MKKQIRKCVFCGKRAEYGMICNECNYGKGLGIKDMKKLLK